jgi:hypothetical protein
MVESICGQGFTYMHEVEEDWAKELIKLGLEAADKKKHSSNGRSNQSHAERLLL